MTVELTAEEQRQEEERRRKYQAELDRWWQSQRDLAEEERRIRREIDPFGWGHWR
jgi:hypothetical protein